MKTAQFAASREANRNLRRLVEAIRQLTISAFE
jgi:hypothetical protein